MTTLFTSILVALLLMAIAPQVFIMIIIGCVPLAKKISRVAQFLWGKLTGRTGRKGRKKALWSTTSENHLIPNIQKQLINQDRSFYGSQLNERSLHSVDTYTEVKKLEAELLAFATELNEKNLFVDFFRHRMDTDYKIDSHPFCLDVSKRKNGYSIYLLYTKNNVTETFCMASFPLDGNRISIERVLVHYGYKEFHHGISHVYTAFVNRYLKDIEKIERYNKKYESVNEGDQVVASLSTESSIPAPDVQKASVQQSEKLENELIHTLANALHNLKEQIVLETPNMSIEEEHRLSVILTDCDHLLDTYRSLTVNNEAIENQILHGLQVGIEKLTEMQGAVYQTKEKEVQRRIEVLRQR